MSEKEDPDDYMSTLYVKEDGAVVEDNKDDANGGASTSAYSGRDIRPGLLKRKKDIREHELYKKRIKMKLEQQGNSEESKRAVGMKTALSGTNKGFTMLHKMGYVAGTALGKTNVGLVEPLDIVFKSKNNKSGLGNGTTGAGTSTTSTKITELKMKELELKFRQNNLVKKANYVTKKYYYRAQKVCANLDHSENIVVPEMDYYWPSAEVIVAKARERGISEEFSPLILDEDTDSQKTINTSEIRHSEFEEIVELDHCSLDGDTRDPVTLRMMDEDIPSVPSCKETDVLSSPDDEDNLPPIEELIFPLEDIETDANPPTADTDDERSLGSETKQANDIDLTTLRTAAAASSDEDTDTTDELPPDIEENLRNIAHYLRSRYNYCVFCAAKGSDLDDLESFCPGPYISDHTDLDDD